ncbi:MAG: hypothetical protein LVQ95_00655 [Candidatus Micrarchaeales archaeon]|nr:hypothetical protein [Candidatus Micrarchaeales archaeon]
MTSARATTVGELLGRHEQLLRRGVDAAHTFDDWLSIARGKGNHKDIDSAELATNVAVLRQAAIKALAARGLPANTPILDDLEGEIAVYATSNPNRGLARSKANRVVDALLRKVENQEEPSEETLEAMNDAESGIGLLPVNLDEDLYGQLHQRRKFNGGPCRPKTARN